MSVSTSGAVAVPLAVDAPDADKQLLIEKLQDDNARQAGEIDELLLENHQTTAFYEDKLSELSDKFDRKSKHARFVLTEMIRTDSER